MTNCPAPLVPTLEQLTEFRRTGRVPKVDVLKSAAELVPVFNPHTGELLGFGERVDVSKGADPNVVLDDLFFVSEVVEKSADFEDDIQGIFPPWLQDS